jgi:N-acetylglucosamine-6-phosphate deacetylase
MTTTYYNGIIYTGYEVLRQHAVVTGGNRILKIIPWEGLPKSADEHAQPSGDPASQMQDTWVDLEGGNLAPAFIDLQIYGGQGLLFSDHPSLVSIQATYRYSLEGGAAYIQPTMATQSDDLIDKAIEAVAEYQAQELPGVIGLHLEGPYINPVKRGAHREDLIQVPRAEKLKTLLGKAGNHLTMMTIAPERCDPALVGELIKAGVTVSAGHTNATYAEALRGFDLGIPAATHLFNAMTPLGHRAPGMVGALLDRGNVYTSIVADGHHVDFAAIRLAKRLLGDKLYLITDAVTPNTEGVYKHQLSGDKYVVPDGTLSGSALTMIKAVQNCVEQVRIPLDEALRMASLYPARVMGLEDRLGAIQPGMEASLVWFDKDYRVRKVFVG